MVVKVFVRAIAADHVLDSMPSMAILHEPEHGLIPDADPTRSVRRWRSVAEKRWVVELTLEPGASVVLVARVHGVNANQIFKW
jgi:hypothetical protein